MQGNPETEQSPQGSESSEIIFRLQVIDFMAGHYNTNHLDFKEDLNHLTPEVFFKACHSGPHESPTS